MRRDAGTGRARIPAGRRSVALVVAFPNQLRAAAAKVDRLRLIVRGTAGGRAVERVVTLRR